MPSPNLTSDQPREDTPDEIETGNRGAERLGLPPLRQEDLGLEAVPFRVLWVQIDGLIGSRGILPLRDHLDRGAANTNGNPFWDAPSLFWWWPTDTALHVLCGLGCALSIALVAAVPLEGPVLLVLWALYLSLSQVGQVFLGYAGQLERGRRRRSCAGGWG